MAGRVCSMDSLSPGVCGTWWETAVNTVRSEGIRVCPPPLSYPSKPELPSSYLPPQPLLLSSSHQGLLSSFSHPSLSFPPPPSRPLLFPPLLTGFALLLFPPLPSLPSSSIPSHQSGVSPPLFPPLPPLYQDPSVLVYSIS